MNDFKFDEKKHVYTLDGKRMYGITNVLGVIAKPALIQWAATEAVNYLKTKLDEEGVFLPEVDWRDALEEARLAHRRKKETAADAGTDVHAVIEKIVRVSIEEDGGYITDPEGIQEHAIAPIANFIKWAQSENIRFIESEKKLYSREHWVAGTCDLVFEKDGKTYIGDIKTYKKLWDRTPMLQCAAYGMMWEEMTDEAQKDNRDYEGTAISGYCVIRIKDDDFEVKWSYDVAGDREGFLAALKLFKTLENW